MQPHGIENRRVSSNRQRRQELNPRPECCLVSSTRPVSFLHGVLVDCYNGSLDRRRAQRAGQETNRERETRHNRFGTASSRQYWRRFWFPPRKLICLQSRNTS